MLRSVGVVLVLALCNARAATAQEEGAQEAGAPALGGEALIMMQVQQEEMMARRYTDAILTLQKSQMDMTAASLWMHQAFQQLNKDAPASIFLEVDNDDGSKRDIDAEFGGYDDDDDDALIVEYDPDTRVDSDRDGYEHALAVQTPTLSNPDDDDDLDILGEGEDQPYDVFGEDDVVASVADEIDLDVDVEVDEDGVVELVDQGIDEDDRKQLSTELLASYYLFRGIGIQTYQTIFQAGDLQREFYMDRVMQLRAQSTPGIPPQLLQILYMKQYSTTLKTMKLAYALQMISTYKSWLEDAMDVYGSVVSGAPNAFAVFTDHEDDLLRHRLWAFSAFNSYAMLDFQLFYIEYYMEMTIAQLFGGAPMQAASFVQEEMKEGVEAEPSQFIPMMGMAQNPALMLKLYKMYHAFYQVHAARSALLSAQLDQRSYQMATDNDEDNDEEAEKLSNSADVLFGHGFAHGLFMTSQIEYITGIFELYSMYAPVGMPGHNNSN